MLNKQVLRVGKTIGQHAKQQVLLVKKPTNHALQNTSLRVEKPTNHALQNTSLRIEYPIFSNDFCPFNNSNSYKTFTPH